MKWYRHLLRASLMLVVLVGILLVVGVFSRGGAAQPPATVDFAPGIVFGKGGEQELKLDLARPKVMQGKAPALVMIHGGGWLGGDRSAFHDLQFNLAHSGMVCVTVQYRLAPKNKFPAQLEDVKCAVRWLRAHADEYGVDPDRIAAFGVSAGAHLSVLLALTEKQTQFEGKGGWEGQSSRVSAAVGLAGPYDLALGYTNSAKQSAEEGPAVRQMLTSFLGGSLEEVPEQYRVASPITYAGKEAPPLLLCHGEADTLVLVEQSDVLAEKLRAAGADVTYLRMKDGTHNNFGKDQNQHILQIVGFLRKHLKMDP